jgi:hypothetical protein
MVCVTTHHPCFPFQAMVRVTTRHPFCPFQAMVRVTTHHPCFPFQAINTSLASFFTHRCMGNCHSVLSLLAAAQTYSERNFKINDNSTQISFPGSAGYGYTHHGM